MERRCPPEELFDFPCDHLFKAFGPTEPDGVFREAVIRAVASVVPVGQDQVKQRASSQGRYICVTVVVRLHNFSQVEAVYAALRRIPGLRYLL